MVKRGWIVLVLLIFVSSISFGQQALEAEKSMSMGLNNSLILELPNSKIQEVEEEWIDFIKKYKGKKTKKNKKTNEIFSDNIVIEGMSKNTVDIYAKVIPMGEGCQLITWYNLGGAYLSSAEQPKGYWVGQTMLKDFKKTLLIREATDQVNIKEKELKQLKGDLSDLVKKQKDQTSKIAELKAELEKMGKKAAETAKEQEAKKQAVAKQKELVEVAKEQLNNAKNKE